MNFEYDKGEEDIRAVHIERPLASAPNVLIYLNYLLVVLGTQLTLEHECELSVHFGTDMKYTELGFTWCILETTEKLPLATRSQRYLKILFFFFFFWH